jgi:hypothetical protein
MMLFTFAKAFGLTQGIRLKLLWGKTGLKTSGQT